MCTQFMCSDLNIGLIMKDKLVNWYLLQTKPNAHATACEHLRRQGFEVFLPFLTEQQKRMVNF